MSIRVETQILFFITTRHKHLTYISWPHNLVVSHNSLSYVDIIAKRVGFCHALINISMVGWSSTKLTNNLQVTFCASCEIQLIGLPCDTFVWSISLQLEIIYFSLTIIRLSNNQSFPSPTTSAGSFPTYRNINFSLITAYTQTLTVFPIANKTPAKGKWNESGLLWENG